MAWRRTVAESSYFLASACVQQLLYRRQQLPETLNSILIAKLDHIGDVLLSLPVLANLREAYPDAHITMLTGAWMVGLLEHHPWVDEVICYNAPFFARTASATPFRHRWQLFRALHARQHDLMVDLRGSWFTLLCGLTRCTPYRLDRASRNVGWRLHRNGPSHELARNLEVLSPIPTPHTVPSWPVPATIIHQAWMSVLAKGILLTRPIFALHCGSPVALKRWPSDRFTELAAALIERYDAQILFVGAAGERDLIEAIRAQIESPSWNLAGETSLIELLGLLKNCTGFIGNDSGPMHLAACAGIPTIGLFGPSSPERFGPVGEHVQTLRHKPDCAPCMVETCRFGGNGCMGEISVGMVLQAVEQSFLDSNSQ